jgi:hypothetical protein
MKIFIPVGIIIFLFAISSCYYDSKEFLYPEISKCDTAHVTYKYCVMPILSNYCIGCHYSSSKGGGVNLDNYTDVKFYVDNGKLMASIKHTGTYPMPKNQPKIPDSEITILDKWIADLAPNN